jgi:hypothetical protein
MYGSAYHCLYNHLYMITIRSESGGYTMIRGGEIPVFLSVMWLGTPCGTSHNVQKPSRSWESVCLADSDIEDCLAASRTPTLFDEHLKSL